jgi:hypothetical protein
MKIEDFFQRIEAITPLHGEISPIPSDELLSAYERQTDFYFPLDYKSFVKKYGVGEIANFYRIFAPIDTSVNGDTLDLLRFNQGARSRPLRFDQYNDKAITVQLILFCSSGGGDWYAWNKLEMKEQSKYEYTIYGLERGSTEISQVSFSFVDFLEICCRRSLWDEEDKKEDWTFVRG